MFFLFSVVTVIIPYFLSKKWQSAKSDNNVEVEKKPASKKAKKN